MRDIGRSSFDMHFYFVSTILWLITSKGLAFVGDNMFSAIQNDFKELNFSCTAFDSCTVARTSDTLDKFSCQCGPNCVMLDTCCYDSPHRAVKSPKTRQTCRSLDSERAFFMVDHCPKSNTKDGIWETLCEKEWDGENNVMKLVPVTSLLTLNTYKNYFCFRCHERTDEFLYWNVRLGSSKYEFDEIVNKSKITPYYFRRYETWVARIGKGGTAIPVNLDIEIPAEILSLPIFCEPLITNCSDIWTDEDVREKCEAYMGVVCFKRNDKIIKYRNVHCALCNFENLDEMRCQWRLNVTSEGKVPFSFTHLLDINNSDGEEVGKVQVCRYGYLWDPFSKICRRLLCAVPGYVIRNGVCTRP